ncbi:MAG: J domain-containing protein [Brevinematia bacterium]
MSNFIDYYQILQLDFGATIDEIKSSFRKLAKTYHPDVSKKNDKDFKIIIEAYKVLSDPELRKKYDEDYLKYRSSKEKVHSKKEKKVRKGRFVDQSRVEYKMSFLNLTKAGFDLRKKFSREDFLEELGEDIVVYLTDEEVREGAILKIKIPARSVCPVCYGGNRNCYLCDGIGYVNVLEEIQVDIPSGMKDNNYIDIHLSDYPKKRGITKFSFNQIRIRVRWLSIANSEL